MVKQIPLRTYDEANKKWGFSDSLFILVDDDDYERLKNTGWNIHPKNGHVYRSQCRIQRDFIDIEELGLPPIRKDFPSRSPYLYRRVLGLGPKGRLPVVHLDGNKLNNQKDNLQIRGKDAHLYSIHNPSHYQSLPSKALPLKAYTPDTAEWDCSKQQALIDAEDFDRLAAIDWQCHREGHVCALPDGVSRLHRVVLNLTPEDAHRRVIHINGNRLDNRKCNLKLLGNGKRERKQKTAPSLLLDIIQATAESSQAILKPKIKKAPKSIKLKKRGRPPNPYLIEAKEKLFQELSALTQQGIRRRHLLGVGFSKQTTRRILQEDWPHVSLATLQRAIDLFQTRLAKCQTLKDEIRAMREGLPKNSWNDPRHSIIDEKLKELKQYELN